MLELAVYKVFGAILNTDLIIYTLKYYLIDGVTCNYFLLILYWRSGWQGGKTATNTILINRKKDIEPTVTLFYSFFYLTLSLIIDISCMAAILTR